MAPESHKAQTLKVHQLGWILVFAIVYADIGTSVFYTPGILFMSIGKLATLAQIITTLVFFNVANGAHPDGVLVPGPDGNFYGTTSQGGATGLGTIFRLSIPMPAVIKAITLADGTVTLIWKAVVGQTYQLQYSTDLAQPDWNPLGKFIVAPNGTMTTTDSDAAGSPQRYYRVVLFP